MRPRVFSIVLSICAPAFAIGAIGAAEGVALAQPKKPAAPQDLVQQAQQLFDDQQYEESIAKLSAALVRPNNTQEQRVAIYRLLALNYITLGRKDEAESSVRGLLVIAPDYQLPANESPRFRDFFASARKKWEDEGRPGLVKEQPTQKPVVLKHGSPSQVDPEKNVELHAKVEDPDARVAHVRLYYRTGTKGDFVEVEAQRDGDSVRTQIPGSAVHPPLVEYYLVAVDANGDAVASRGDATSPIRIAVPEPSKGWVLPVAIGGGILGAAAIVGGLALAGVFKSSSGGGGGGGNKSTVSINIGESGVRF